MIEKGRSQIDIELVVFYYCYWKIKRRYGCINRFGRNGQSVISEEGYDSRGSGRKSAQFMGETGSGGKVQKITNRFAYKRCRDKLKMIKEDLKCRHSRSDSIPWNSCTTHAEARRP